MINSHPIDLTVNGRRQRCDVAPRRHLVDFLREDLGLTGSHLGCEHGVCGACTVKVDGRIARGCLMLAVQCNGREVETIEGATERGDIRDLQDAFVARNALQCGYCTPGMVMAAIELIETQPDASRDEIRAWISGNYCRCTGYQAIVDAVSDVLASRRRGKRPNPPDGTDPAEIPGGAADDPPGQASTDALSAG